MAVTQSKSKSTAQKARKTAKVVKKKAQAAPKVLQSRRTNQPFAPTNDQRTIVQLAAAVGMTEPLLCGMIINPETNRPISPMTLRKAFENELANGREVVLMKIAGTLASVATDKNHKGCVTAGIYLTKVLGRWREPEPEWSERKRAEQEDPETGDIEITAVLVLEDPKPQLPPPGATVQ